MNFPKLRIFFRIGLLLLPFIAFGQQPEVTVTYGGNTIDVSEKFTIKIVIRAKEYEVTDFPEINGLGRSGRSVAHITYRENGSRGIQHTITQSYVPKKPGTFKLAPSTLTVNGKPINLPAETIRVTTEPSVDVDEGVSTINIREDALVALTVRKDSVFVGEGFRVTVSFFVSDINTAGWDFPPDLNAQVDKIAQQIKPGNCLESRLEITSVKAERTVVKGKQYSQYKVFEAVYYPLNDKPITIPPVTLTMLREGDDTIGEEKRSFKTEPARLTIKPLPDHPLKDKVAVGNFSMREWLNKSTVETGTSFTYQFRIAGEGNFTTVNLISPENDERFDFYPPEVKGNDREGMLQGDREFQYTIFPKEPGEIALKDYFKFIFFNVQKSQYDTLSATVTVDVSGKKITSAQLKTNDIYAGLENVDASDVPINYRTVLKNLANALVIGMLIALVFMFKR